MTTTWPPMEPGTMEEEIGKPGRAATMSMLLLGCVRFLDGKQLDMMMMKDMMLLILLVSIVYVVGVLYNFGGINWN